MQVKSFNSIGGFSVGENSTDVISNTGNITGNSITATEILVATGNITGGNLITNGVTSTGSLTASTTASVTGNITGGNLITAGLASITGNITGGNLITSGLASVTGNITGGNLVTSRQVIATGNVTGNYFIGNGSQLNSITGANVTGNVPSTTTAYNANVSTVSNNQEYLPLLATGSVGNLSFTASAGISWNPSTYTLTAGKISLGSGIGAQGVTGIYAFGGNTAWQVQSQNGTGTDAQGQEIGRFGSEYTNGSSTFWDSYISYYQGLGSNSGWLKINAAGNSVANVTGTGVSVTGVLSATGNITGGNLITNGVTSTGSLTASTTAVVTGNITGGNLITSGLASVTGNITGGNLITAGLASVTGNITGGNLITAGVLSATGNVTANNVILTGVVSTLRLTVTTSANVTGNTTVGNLITTRGVFTGNVTATGFVSATGNITGGNLITSGLVDVTGNITGGNLITTGNISGNTNGFTIGYLNLPQVVASNVTLSLTDAGKHYYANTAGNLVLTVPNNATTAFATGTTVAIIAQATGNVLINVGVGVTMYMAGNSTSANRVVSTYGMASLVKVATDTWFINGTGVS